jgi:hypothetical protein
MVQSVGENPLLLPPLDHISIQLSTENTISGIFSQRSCGAAQLFTKPPYSSDPTAYEPLIKAKHFQVSYTTTSVSPFA